MSSVQFVFFFQAEDGIRDLVRSRGLGDVYKRQALPRAREKYSCRSDHASDAIAPPESRLRRAMPFDIAKAEQDQITT